MREVSQTLTELRNESFPDFAFVFPYKGLLGSFCSKQHVEDDWRLPFGSDALQLRRDVVRLTRREAAKRWEIAFHHSSRQIQITDLRRTSSRTRPSSDVRRVKDGRRHQPSMRVAPACKRHRTCPGTERRRPPSQQQWL